MTPLPYDICLRLRDAGLPQPEGAIGQFWYLTRYPGGTLENDVLSVVMQHYSNSKNLTFMPLDGGNNPNQHLKVFCPDAEYLIEHLPNGYKFKKKSDGIHFGPKEAIKSDFDIEKSITHAAATAYLHIHEKTPA